MTKLRLSLKQCLGLTAAFAVVAYCVANYESWYGVRWTRTDAVMLAADLASLDGEITEELAIRVAIDTAVGRGNNLRVLPSAVRREVWTRYFDNGVLVDSVDIECYIVSLEDIPDGIDGAFTRIRGGHCSVYVGLDGSVLEFMGGT